MSSPYSPGFSGKYRENGIGLDLPYVHRDIMDTIEAYNSQWEEELVWDYLHDPKSQRRPHNPKVWAWFQDIRQEWNLGQAIYRDCVVNVKARWSNRSYSVATQNSQGEITRLINPKIYC